MSATGVTVRFIGTGDAFGSGGRLQTCILVDAPGVRFAVDFGATSLIGLRRQDIDPNSVDAIFLTHLHGDHCGGVPFLLLDAMLGAKRARRLTIAGPRGTREHLGRLQEVLFPGSAVMTPGFPIDYADIHAGEPQEIAGIVVRAVDARHTRETQPLALRFELGRKSVAYTGDGEYTDALAGLVADVDLLIAESYFHGKTVRWHLNYPDIARLAAKRIVLTHMHTDMLAKTGEVPELCAHDGLVIAV